MSKNYVADKAQKKKTAMKAVWILLFISGVFIAALVKYFIGSSNISLLSAGAPSSNDVYSVAQNFIKPALRKDVQFPESGYEFGKKPDSVYIIKSFFEEKDDTGEQNKRSYEISLKYNGGAYSNKNNWSILSLEF
jgi:hypothetical protein